MAFDGTIRVYDYDSAECILVKRVCCNWLTGRSPRYASYLHLMTRVHLLQVSRGAVTSAVRVDMTNIIRATRASKAAIDIIEYRY